MIRAGSARNGHDRDAARPTGTRHSCIYNVYTPESGGDYSLLQASCMHAVAP